MNNDPSFETGTAVPLAYIICGILIILENSFLIYIILKHFRFDRTSYLFVISLAFTDLFVGALSLTSGVIRLPEVNGQATILLTIQLIMSTTLILLSCAHMTVISIERWLYIAHPYFYQRRVTNRHVICVIISLWCVAFVYLVGMLLLQTQVYSCWPRTLVAIDSTLMITAVCPVYFIAMAGTCLFYVMILIIARRHSRQIADVQMRCQERACHYARSVKIFVVVFGVFFVNTNGVLFAVTINFFTQVPLIIFSIVVPLTYANSTCNFLILFIMDKSFRSASMKQINRRLCRHPTDRT